MHRTGNTQRLQLMENRRRKEGGRKKNSVKILLWIILMLQLVIVCELGTLIRAFASARENISGNMLLTETKSARLYDAMETQRYSVAYEETKAKAENNNYLTLVNKWNPMDPEYKPKLAEVAEGHLLDSSIVGNLQDMIRDAKKAGHIIYIISAYRDITRQTYLYEEEVKEWLAKGYSQRGAEREAAKVVAYPGTSEHHLGLAVDLVSEEHVELDEGAEQTKGYQWLVQHCHEYGFILRYPNGATDITGIIYEPWHFRYVGEEAAEEIMRQGITLEEHLEKSDENKVTGGEK